MCQSTKRFTDIFTNSGRVKNVQTKVNKLNEINWQDKWNNQLENQRNSSFKRCVPKIWRSFESVSRNGEKVSREC